MARQASNRVVSLPRRESGGRPAVSSPHPLIVVDGPTASGKHTLAQNLSVLLGLPYLSSAHFFHAVAIEVLERGAPLDDPRLAGEAARDVNPTLITDLAPSLEGAALQVSRHRPVQDELRRLQEQHASRGGAILVGATKADFHHRATTLIWLTAPIETRIRRYVARLDAHYGSGMDLRSALGELQACDDGSATRLSQPSFPPRTALPIDSSALDRLSVVAAALNRVWETLPETMKAERRTVGALAFVVAPYEDDSYPFTNKYPFARAHSEARVALASELNRLGLNL